MDSIQRYAKGILLAAEATCLIVLEPTLHWVLFLAALSGVSALLHAAVGRIGSVVSARSKRNNIEDCLGALFVGSLIGLAATLRFMDCIYDSAFFPMMFLVGLAVGVLFVSRLAGKYPLRDPAGRARVPWLKGGVGYSGMYELTLVSFAILVICAAVWVDRMMPMRTLPPGEIVLTRVGEAIERKLLVTSASGPIELTVPKRIEAAPGSLNVKRTFLGNYRLGASNNPEPSRFEANEDR